jgi:hypothetical protein
MLKQCTNQGRRKNMTKHAKRIIPFLCLILALTSIFVMPVDATTSRAGALTVTYKGKTETLMTVDDVNDLEDSYSSNGCKAPDTLKKSWGSYVKKKNNGYTDCIFQTGKSSVTISYVAGQKKISWYSLVISIKDKNMALCGVKVGMTKQQAVNTLKKNFGSQAVKVTNKNIKVNFGVFVPINYTLKGGKVTAMKFWHS